jgi:hypothetical protein
VINIPATGEPVKPQAIYPYFDVVVVWLRTPADRRTLAQLRKDCGHLHVSNRRARFDKERTQRLEFKQPSDAVLRWIGTRADGLINYVEVALDFIYASAEERDAADKFFDRHIVRRWHGRNQEIRRFHNVVRYDGPRTARNSLKQYSEDHSRITGELYCLRVEWRINGAQAARAAGIIRPRDVLTFNHRKFWKKRLVLVAVDAGRLGRLLRNELTARIAVG